MSYFNDVQAKEIWKAKWRGATVQSLIRKYGENTFRFYEVWEERKNNGSREKAFEELQREDPVLASSIDPAPHVPTRRVVTTATPSASSQGDMFQ